jgi:Leucine-rich repeat (LRR) protein
MDTEKEGIIRANIAAAAQNGGHLYLAGLGLRELPAEVLAMQHLRVLDLRDNFLEALPSALAKYASLKQLNLSGNRFVEIPPVIRELRALEKLDVSANQIRSVFLQDELPAGLLELDCAHNKIKTLHQLGGPASLTVLKGKDNLIDGLHVASIRGSQLQDLDLESNALTTLPDAFTRLNRLELIRLSKNKLTRVPELFARLPRLGLLELNHNAITGFDWKLDRLPTKLEVLEIRHNQVTALPNWLPMLKKLSLLALDENPIQECAGSCLPASLRRLSINACGLMSLTEVEVCHDLEVLQANSNLLSGNYHLALPASLRLLDLSNNRLEALAIQLPPSTHLETLLLAQNSLAALEIDAQPLRLMRLDLSSNQLTSLSDFYVNSRQLGQIYLADNLLKEIPQGMSSLDHLEILALSKNEIRALPSWIAQKKKLKILWLDHNPLHELPAGLNPREYVALTLHNTTTGLSMLSQPSTLAAIGLNKDAYTQIPASPPPSSTFDRTLRVESVLLWPHTWGIRVYCGSQNVLLPAQRWESFRVDPSGITFEFKCPQEHEALHLPFAQDTTMCAAIERFLEPYLANAIIAGYWDYEPCSDIL